MSAYEAVLAVAMFLVVFGISRLSYRWGYRDGLRRSIALIDEIEARAAAGGTNE